MKETFYYEAEYISQVDHEHFFNVDLGFGVWIVKEFCVENPEVLEAAQVQPHDRFLIKTDIIEKNHGKPYIYTCKIVRGVYRSVFGSLPRDGEG